MDAEEDTFEVTTAPRELEIVIVRDKETPEPLIHHSL